MNQLSPFRLLVLFMGFIGALPVHIALAGERQDAELAAPLPARLPALNGEEAIPEKIALGKQLFFDARLSGDNQISCATCHVPEKAFTDGLAKAKGAADKILSRNTPTLLNVALHSSFFWDGRAKTLQEQALEPIRSPTK